MTHPMDPNLSNRIPSSSVNRFQYLSRLVYILKLMKLWYREQTRCSGLPKEYLPYFDREDTVPVVF